MVPSVLIIDDEEDIGWSFRKALTERGFDARFAVKPEEGLMLMRYSPDIVLLDYKMPGMNGIEVLKRIREENPEQLVVMMTGYGTIENAVEAMKLGAFHYIQKPFTIHELTPILDRAIEIIEMRRKLLLSSMHVGKGDFGYLDGNSPMMKSVFKRSQKVADKKNTSVLILGECGTGKEMLAKTIHEFSERKNRPFVALNCSAIPENLLESELFGYEPGAFTGAIKRKHGMFEVADQGTIFLDEIGDMPLGLQSKILRVLEDSTFNRLGAEHDEIRVDIRVVAASNRNLEEMIKKGHFREDLFYRLNTFTIVMPPLREREDDSVDLAMKFIHRFNNEMKIDIKGLTAEAARAIRTYNWPGNVRQLRNAIESAMIECESDRITVENLPFAVRAGENGNAHKVAESFFSSGISTLEEVKKAYVLRVLGQCKTDQEAADALDISRRTITRMKKEMLDNPKTTN